MDGGAGGRAVSSRRRRRACRTSLMTIAYTQRGHEPWSMLQAGNKWTAGLVEGDEHALNVARLQHEVAARQTLLAELQRTRARKVGRQIRP